MTPAKIFPDFLNDERAGGIILIACTIVSLLLTNFFPLYNSWWHVALAGHSLMHWINDGLMTIFFLLVALELRQEVSSGELSTRAKASLPVVAALGGMLVPAAIYYFFNLHQGTLRGAGIPMATDIAFALGVLSLLRKHVPISLRVFLTAFAVIDDLGAIVVIAVFYTSTIGWLQLLAVLGILLFLIVLNMLKVHSLWTYLASGLVMWYCMLHSGVHATMAGVLLGFVIPVDDNEKRSLSYRLQHVLHKPVAFFILPLFALANTSIFVQPDFYVQLGSTVSMGIIIGLLIGKPLGIVSFSYVSTRMKLCSLPAGLSWKHIAGAGMLGGVGFTMSIFISLLAFDNAVLVDESKIAIMVASFCSGTIGFLWLRKFA